MAEIFKAILQVVSFLANIGTISASGLAIYVFLRNRKRISAAINVLLGYSFQLTVSELKEKLERLNDLNAKNEGHRDQIEILFSEIIGQIRGSIKLAEQFSDIADRLDQLLASKARLTEQRKRTAVSELRERLRGINVENIEQLMAGSGNG